MAKAKTSEEQRVLALALAKAASKGLEVEKLIRFLLFAPLAAPTRRPRETARTAAERNRLARALAADRKRAQGLARAANEHDAGGATVGGRDLRAAAEALRQVAGAEAQPTPMEMMRRCLSAPDESLTVTATVGALAGEMRRATGTPQWDLMAELLAAAAALRGVGWAPDAEALRKLAGRNPLNERVLAAQYRALTRSE